MAFATVVKMRKLVALSKFAWDKKGNQTLNIEQV